jgi:hypothetical protein
MGKRNNIKSRRSRRRPINDVPMNNTNIRVKFKKAITFNYVNFQSKIELDPEISTLTKDLAVVYKLWRCTHLSLEFQAASTISGGSSQPRYGINYIPALESTSALALNIEDYEGPAVGFWQANRGHPYRYTIPGNVLNAMPYNWYETKSNSPDPSDRIQGMLLSTCDFEEDSQTALLTVEFEFQTLEDPDFLASLAKSPLRTNHTSRMVGENKQTYEVIHTPLVRRSASRARN